MTPGMNAGAASGLAMNDDHAKIAALIDKYSSPTEECTTIVMPLKADSIEVYLNDLEASYWRWRRRQARIEAREQRRKNRRLHG